MKVLFTTALALAALALPALAGDDPIGDLAKDLVGGIFGGNGSGKSTGTNKQPANPCPDGGALTKQVRENPNPTNPSGDIELFCIKDGVRFGPYVRETTVSRFSSFMKEVTKGGFIDGIPVGKWVKDEKEITLETVLEENFCDPQYRSTKTDTDGENEGARWQIYTCEPKYGATPWTGVGVILDAATGKVRVAVQAKNGRFEGDQASFDVNGKLTGKGPIKDGKETGRWEYFEDGKKVAEGEFSNGRKVGVWKYWSDGGETTETEQERVAAERSEKARAKKAAEAKRDRAKVAAIAAKQKREATLYCKCQATERFIQSQIDREHAVGAASGYVNKVKLHGLGQNLVTVREYLSSLQNRAPASECAVKPGVSAAQDCLEAAAQNVSERYLGE